MVKISLNETQNHPQPSPTTSPDLKEIFNSPNCIVVIHGQSIEQRIQLSGFLCHCMGIDVNEDIEESGIDEIISKSHTPIVDINNFVAEKDRFKGVRNIILVGGIWMWDCCWGSQKYKDLKSFLGNIPCCKESPKLYATGIGTQFDFNFPGPAKMPNSTDLRKVWLQFDHVSTLDCMGYQWLQFLSISNSEIVPCWAKFCPSIDLKICNENGIFQTDHESWTSIPQVYAVASGLVDNLCFYGTDSRALTLLGYGFQRVDYK